MTASLTDFTWATRDEAEVFFYCPSHKKGRKKFLTISTQAFSAFICILWNVSDIHANILHECKNLIQYYYKPMWTPIQELNKHFENYSEINT